MILGILGVETGYGANKGSFVTRDALATLAFGYPRRAEYFSDELGALIAGPIKKTIQPAALLAHMQAQLAIRNSCRVILLNWV